VFYNIISQKLFSSQKREENDAFEELYDKYSSALLSIALKITKNQQLAEDVLQESFIKIWKNIAKFNQSKATLFTWMLNITRNTAIDLIRKRNFTQNIQLDSSIFPELEERVNNSLNINTIGLKELIQELRPEHQEVINAVYLSELTHEEASVALDLPLGTLKTRVRKALKELKSIYSIEWPLIYN
jgi:RNA polymerase sigma-70 factor, ECF subfamily